MVTKFNINLLPETYIPSYVTVAIEVTVVTVVTLVTVGIVVRVVTVVTKYSVTIFFLTYSFVVA